jgi:hypothetical protein
MHPLADSDVPKPRLSGTTTTKTHIDLRARRRFNSSILISRSAAHPSDWHRRRISSAESSRVPVKPARRARKRTSICVRRRFNSSILITRLDRLTATPDRFRLALRLFRRSRGAVGNVQGGIFCEDHELSDRKSSFGDDVGNVISCQLLKIVRSKGDGVAKLRTRQQCEERRHSHAFAHCWDSAGAPLPEAKRSNLPEGATVGAAACRGEAPAQRWWDP